MFGMDAWDLALLAIAGYVSVTTLVRMMRRRRDSLIEQLVEEARAEQQRQRIRKQKEQRRELHERIMKQRLQHRDAA